MTDERPHASAGSSAGLVRPGVVPSLAMFLSGLLLMLALHAYGRPFTRDGVHFQRHSSEDMMQTLSLLDLREDPVGSLLVLHIQPPLFDALRALLAALWPKLERHALVVRVDQALYLFWALAYAGIGALVFAWLRRLLGRPGLAALAAFLFLLHPAAIYYATYLDTTIVTAFGILWLSWALSSLRGGGTTLSLVAAFVFLFLLRSIFQWPALVVLLAALLLRQVPRRRVVSVLAACGVVVAGYMVKQYLVIGSVSSSSFAGSSCLHALGENPAMGFSSQVSIPLGPLMAGRSFDSYPEALTRPRKILRAHNYNHVADLDGERRLLAECRARWRRLPARDVLRGFADSAAVFLQPSSQYLNESHAIVDRLPWRAAYDWLFSGWRLLLLLAGAALAWMRGRDRAELRRGLGLALPVLFVASASIVFERAENMRYKFFVEPVLYVFVVGQLLAASAVRRPARPLAHPGRIGHHVSN